jgi:hypothetical protein
MEPRVFLERLNIPVGGKYYSNKYFVVGGQSYGGKYYVKTIEAPKVNSMIRRTLNG